MGALGNLLAALTIAPTLFQQVALDFSTLPVLIAGGFGGPVLGAITGIIAGILPSAFFGFVGGQLGVLGFTTSLGKAIQGFTIGMLVRWFKPSRERSLLYVPIVLVSFIPEMFWIILVFTVFVPFFLPAQGFLATIVGGILVKAWFEMAVMSVFMSALAGHGGFRSFMAGYLRIPRTTSKKHGS